MTHARKIVCHFINHTHWDREWFATFLYTREWLPQLIQEVGALVQKHPDYIFLLDGQTLVLDDLRVVDTEAYKLAEKLIGSGNLLVGPYYAQLDWKLPGGESLLRNMEVGTGEARALGVEAWSGWLVDAFGHISQSPQIHRLFGIDHVFIWRGVNTLSPFISWSGADGSFLTAVNLFAGGYRNLYGVTKETASARRRLEKEVQKLLPYYPHGHIPLFDGYDLDQHPEDPELFYREQGAVGAEMTFLTSSPARYFQSVKEHLSGLPAVNGELLSGKLAATFTGTLSARTYLKILNRDVESLWYRYVEPLLALAGVAVDGDALRFEKELLQNQVHDCICGVSIDQVHERMEYSYQRLIAWGKEELVESLARIGSALAPGVYAFCPSGYQTHAYIVQGLQVLSVDGAGVGIYPAVVVDEVEQLDVPLTEDYEWSNRYCQVVLTRTGRVKMNGMTLGTVVLWRERGDAYSDEPFGRPVVLQAEAPPILVERSAFHRVFAYSVFYTTDDFWVKLAIRITFDLSELIKWDIEVESTGSNFSVDIHFATHTQTRRVFAGMPFDIVERKVHDTDLLPKELREPLKSILQGQREIHTVHSYPFHDYVGIADGSNSLAVFAQGLRAYRADIHGTIGVLLRRSVPWLMNPEELNDRIGDAGPKFYVPGAACQRKVVHRLAFASLPVAPEAPLFQAINDSFQHPPLLFAVSSSTGRKRSLPWFSHSLPITQLRRCSTGYSMRTFNPARTHTTLYRPLRKLTADYQVAGKVRIVEPKKIVLLEPPTSEFVFDAKTSATVEVLNFSFSRVGRDETRSDERYIQKLYELEKDLAGRLEAIEGRLNIESASPTVLKHHYFVVARELCEARLSLALNRLRDRYFDRLSPEYLFEKDAEIERLTTELNELRSKRRMYDYIVGVFEQEEEGK